MFFFLAKMPSEVFHERRNYFWDFLNLWIGTTDRATKKKTITSSERTRNGLSNDTIFFKKICGRISFINRIYSAVNRPTVVIFILMESQFDVLLNDTKIAKN